LIKDLLATVPQAGYSVSMTTREPRFGEEHGHHYNFVSREKFEDEIQAGGFLEYAEVHGNLYGTSRHQTECMTEQGIDVILEIDVQGANLVREAMPKSVSIFILPPSFEILKARLTSRATEDPDDLALRLKNSYDEVMQYSRFDYVVVNDRVSVASRKLAAIILAERQRTDRQSEAVQSILDSFEQSKHQITGD